MNKSVIIIGLIIPFLAVGLRMEGDFVYLLFLGSLVFFGRKRKIDGKYLVLTGLLLLVVCSFLMIIDEILAQKLAVWAFLALLSGAVLLFWETEIFKRESK